MIPSAPRAHPRLLATAILLLGLAGGGLLAPTSVEASQPAVRFIAVAGYRLAVSGTGWQPSGRVTIAVSQSGRTQGLLMRASAMGAFTVGIRNLDLCAGPSVVVRDLKGHRVALQVAPRACPPRAPRMPVLHILRGWTLVPSVVRVAGLQPPAVVMHRGDELHLWEAGTSAPAWQPRVDPAYLILIRQGVSPPRLCPQPDCAAGFFWDYVAGRVGETGVELSAACRASRPPCGVPDFILRVSILP